MASIVMMQGDSYYIPFKFYDEDGTQITSDMVDDVEIVIDGVRKTLAEDEIEYDSEDDSFLWPLTQEESFSFDEFADIQARVRFTSGDVVGVAFGSAYVQESASKVEL